MAAAGDRKKRCSVFGALQSVHEDLIVFRQLLSDILLYGPVIALCAFRGDDWWSGRVKEKSCADNNSANK